MNPSQPRTPSLLEDRRAFLVLAGAGGAHLALTAAGLPGWPCPFRMAFGLPCPGCGLTRATLALLRGDWSHALAIHAFAPLAVVAFGGIVLGALLPTTPRARLTAALVRFDSRFRVGWLLLGSLLIYWLTRFSLDGPAFRQLAT
jgi:hypothetical protein